MTCTSCRRDLPDAARFCPSCGTPCPVPAGTAPDDERKLVTVVFCDLVGSTALSGTLDPETLRSVTLRYFDLMSRRIEACGGTPEKFIGDAVMAVFGVPVVREDDARRALAAALGMLDALDGLNAELDAALGIRLDVRIGVNTGQVVAGADATARQALISGETVNIAARLEQNAGPGDILIGPQTLLAAGPTVTVEEVGPLRLKGKTESVHAYRLLALGADDPELLRRFDVPFVGRERELAELDAALDRAATGKGAQLLHIGGEAGIGKTRLAREWLRRRTEISALPYGAGRCRTYGDHGTLAPLADAVRDLLAAAGTDITGNRHGPPTGSAAADEALALLTGGLLRDGTPNSSVDDTCAALAVVLELLARRRPVVLLLDDCHWAGPALLETVDRLVGLLGRAAVLVVRLARPDLLDGRTSTGEPVDPGRRTLSLTGLSGTESARLAAGLADLDAHQDTAPAGLLARAEGNPLYLEQLLATSGTGTGPLGDGDDELPATVQALLEARIGALGRGERTALDLAAIVGREFTERELVRLSRTGPGPDGRPTPPSAGGPPDGRGDAGGRGDVVVPAALARLSRRRLIEPGPATSGQGLFRFSSGLVQEVAYQCMSKRAKAERHERAAELPSVLRGGDGAIGGHLERAHRYRAELGLLDERTETLRGRSVTALTRAGTQALARSDLHWAHDLLGRAAQLCPTGEQAAVPALRALGEVRVALGRTDEGRSLLTQVLTTATDPVETAHARLALAVLATRPDPDAITGTVHAVLPVFEAADDATGQARAHLRLAQQRQRAGRHDEAYRYLGRALRHAVRAEAEPERAAALGAMGVSLWRGPEPVPTAVARCRTLLAEHGGGRRTVRVTLNCPLAVLLALQDRADEARDCLAEADRLAGELGYAEAEVFLPVFRATVEALLGRRQEALDLVRRADEAARALGAPGMLAAVGLDTARLLLDAGRPARARQRLTLVGPPEALPYADTIDLDGLLGRLAAAEGAAERALRHVESAVAAAARTDSPLVQAVAALDRAETLLLLGRRTEAAASARVAGARFSDKGHLPGVRRAGRLAARAAGATDTERS
ncbi:adenylate/guanylate cyclase domain-containing protein [Streptomyces sp. DT24]|uniref:adenylate/guanylate cyclase domain-containing protein n=1 Tax=Streptomyces sp. DT24 TaxID=3416520 RepID=UPI003CF34681